MEGMNSVKSAEVCVCPPYLYITEVLAKVQGSDIHVGAQDVAKEKEGAYTGEVSVDMLNDIQCNSVIIGHSERRAYYGDTDQMVAEKFSAAIGGGLRPILCVGELLEEREANKTEQVVERQLQAVVEKCGISSFKKAVIAYEPVWAIGTGKTASPEQAQDVHAFIRNWIAKSDADVAQNVQILYGGSVKSGNAAELFSQADIDGGLIGGASLDASEFLKICIAAG